MINAGEMIRTCRKLKGISKRELAKRAGVSHATVYYIEAGQHTPRVDMLEWLVNACGYDMQITITERKEE